jgi:hypothetical protein
MMVLILFVIVFAIGFHAPDWALKLLPSTSIDCSVDIDGAPKSETYPECYCKHPWKPGQVPGRPECQGRE